ncbi:hypothetical protein EXIGLDRAFT_710613 [Exidia glandulosa HHB12029]|uniref:Integral membrane protein n=1 Tax=Exidia glandulosa HHB12029 TaxID=1314781 RepID=A0A165GVT8_EXIGL|nr:hypothetical protein EXIGLDRAFT_710613 [Exidia glandulosa HHB12029]
MPAQFFVPSLIAGMIAAGTANSLLMKFQDLQCVENCEDPKNRVLFEQPVWQCLNMFLGEMACFVPVLLSAWTRSTSTPAQEQPKPHGQLALTGWRVLWLWLPAACDLMGTTLMNVGLLYTPVSIYQMTRGSLVLFVGCLSVVFLHRRLWLYQWLSLLVVVAGVAVVGLSGSLAKKALPVDGPGLLAAHAAEEPEPSSRIVLTGTWLGHQSTGVLFIAFAQLFTATQFVVEEKIMERYSVAPLVAVGWEGFYGVLTIVLAAPILYTFREVSPFFDLPRGWNQLIGNPTVLWAGLAIACSIACFNFFGLSVTRYVSATARSLTDTCRTISIWLISLALGWEHFVVPASFLQVTGFGLLVYFTFNNLLSPPKFLRPPPLEPYVYEPLPTEGTAADADERTRLLAQEHLDETARLPADLGTSGYDVVPPPERSN